MGKKTEYLLVDGYNIIYSWNNLKKLANSSLEDARVKLLDILSDYRGVVTFEIIVVFDAHLVKGNIRSIEKSSNLVVVYTKESESADNYIERISKNLAKDYRIRVATSDSLEQMIILSNGAYRISANELLLEVNASKKQIRNDFIQNKSIKKNMLLDNLDEKTAELLEKMRRSKGE